MGGEWGRLRILRIQAPFSILENSRIFKYATKVNIKISDINKWMGRSLKVNKAKPREDNRGGGGGSFGGGGGGRQRY